jgi:hypothetical protein
LAVAMWDMIGPPRCPQRSVPWRLSSITSRVCVSVIGNSQAKNVIACWLLSKHRSGVLAAIPRGSKPTRSNRA